MIAWVVVLHQLRVFDYSFCYSVCYQQTVFVVSLCGCVCPIVLFVNVFVLCNGTIKMLIVISGFTCLCQCVFLIICNLSSFSVRNGGKYVLRCFPQQKTNLLDFNIKIGTQPSLSWFDQSLVISCLLSNQKISFFNQLFGSRKDCTSHFRKD